MAVHFFTTILLGLSIALPVGAVTIEMVKQGMKNGFLHGWFVGLGGMTVDLSLILALYLGFAPLLSLSFIQTIMWLIGCIFLSYLGLESILHAGHDIHLEKGKSRKSLKSSYLTGFIVAISPGSVIFWLGIFGTTLSNSLHTAGISGFLIAVVGILAGIQIHDVILMTIISKTRAFLNGTVVKWVSILAGCLLLGFAVYFGVEFVKRM